MSLFSSIKKVVQGTVSNPIQQVSSAVKSGDIGTIVKTALTAPVSTMVNTITVPGQIIEDQKQQAAEKASASTSASIWKNLLAQQEAQKAAEEASKQTALKAGNVPKTTSTYDGDTIPQNSIVAGEFDYLNTGTKKPTTTTTTPLASKWWMFGGTGLVLAIITYFITKR